MRVILLGVSVVGFAILGGVSPRSGRTHRQSAPEYGKPTGDSRECQQRGRHPHTVKIPNNPFPFDRIVRNTGQDTAIRPGGEFVLIELAETSPRRCPISAKQWLLDVLRRRTFGGLSRYSFLKSGSRFIMNFISPSKTTTSS